MKDFFDRMVSEPNDPPNESSGDAAQPSANGQLHADAGDTPIEQPRK